MPTLVDGDKVIPESNVILEYLEEAYPEPRLSWWRNGRALPIGHALPGAAEFCGSARQWENGKYSR